MKVLLVNGSPHAAGSTNRALSEVAGVLREEGVEAEVFQLGAGPISGCVDCRRCTGVGRCAIDDIVNLFIDRARETDGFIFGSPVHYAAACGSITSFMGRVFFSSSKGEGVFYLKPAACVLVARRGGTVTAFDQINKYFTISEMPVISSRYWNIVFGTTPDEVAQDVEGLQIMRVLGRNMAWFLKCKKAGEEAGVPFPKREARVFTNFIR